MSNKGKGGKAAPPPAKGGKVAAKPAAKGKGGGGGGGEGAGGILEVKVRHILCEKEAKLMEAVALINSGKSFNSVAMSHSEDKARASGLLGWVKRGDMVGAFTDRAFTQPIGVVSAPFKTQFGISLVEGTCVMISSVYALLPWGFEFNTLILMLIPIFCLLCQQMTSYTTIHLTSTVLFGSLCASLYIYLVMLITRNTIWITFIVTFFFSYLIASLIMVTPRKWMTGFFMKKLFLDVIIVLYFSPVDQINDNIIQNVVGTTFILSSMIITQLVFPILGSRLFYSKTIKAMHTARIYFRAIGYQLEDRLYINDDDDGNTGDKEYKVNIETIKDGCNDTNDEKTSNLFNEIEKQIIKEQQLKHSQTIDMPIPNTSTNTNNTNTTDRLQLPLSRSNIIENVDRKGGNGDYSSNDLIKLEHKFMNEIERMTALFTQSKSERWNAELNSNYNKVLSMFVILFKQLVSIKLAMSNGFSQLANNEIITPLIPFVDCLVEEVYLQMGSIIEIITATIDHEQQIAELYQSFEETKQLVNRVKEAYKEVVDIYEKNGHPISSGLEITKVQYFIHGIMSFTLQQKELTDILITIKKQQHIESVRMELFKNGIVFVIMGFHVFFFNRSKKLYNFLKLKFGKSNIDGNGNGNGSTNKEGEVSILLQCIKWIKINMFLNGRWKYPLQVSVGLMSSIITFYYFQGKSHGPLIISGIWFVATVLLVFVPTMGGTIIKGFHRIIGAIFGGIIGFLTSWLCSIIPSPGKEIVILFITFIFIFIIAFPQQDIRYSYAGSTSGVTFLFIVLGQNISKNFDYFYPIIRTFHIILGVIWAIIIGIVIFPYFSYKGTRIKVFQITNSMSDTFINIIQLGLRLNEPINIELFTNDSTDGTGGSDGSCNMPNEERRKEITNLILKYPLEINNIIQISNDGEEIRKQEKKKIFESLRLIRIGIDGIKSSLYDIRAELVLVAPTKTNKYFSIISKLNNSLTALATLENSFNPIFSDIMILTMFDLKEPLFNLFKQLNNSKFELNQLIQGKYSNSSKSLEIIMKSSNSIKESMDKFNQMFKLIKVNLLHDKVIHNLYPQMIQLGSGIHSIQTFISTYIILLEDLRSIRKERSYIKAILRIKQ